MARRTLDSRIDALTARCDALENNVTVLAGLLALKADAATVAANDTEICRLLKEHQESLGRRITATIHDIHRRSPL